MPVRLVPPRVAGIDDIEVSLVMGRIAEGISVGIDRGMAR